MRDESLVVKTEERLLGSVARGEPGAVKACLDQYGSLVWSLALRRTASREEAEDAVQEIFVDIWRSAERYDPAKSSEAGFVALIARRRLIDRSRKASRRPILTQLPDGLQAGSDDHEALERRVEASQLLEMVNELPEKQRDFIHLAIVTGLSHTQIAERTDTPLGTVKSNIRRGLAEIRRQVTGSASRDQTAGAS